MADFKFYLNRQGPKGEPGAKGEKGDNGNTPTFSDGINTPTVYTMQIDMGDGNVFETQNLKYPMRDDGGNYLRYDRTNSTVTLSAPNIADLQRTSGEVTLASVSDLENEDAQDTDAVSMELRNADQLALSNEINRIDRDIDTVDTKVDREIQNRQDADTALSERIDGLDSSKADKTDVYTKTQTDALLNGKANAVHTHNLSQITDAGSLAGKNTVDYSTEVTNKPTIGDGTITITQGGVTKGTFTTNQSGNSTIALDAGGGGGAYTEGAGITIGQNNEISVNVDNDTIVIDRNSLKANIPDVSNFVSNTQLASTLESYPTNNALSNAITYQTVSVPTPATYTFDRIMNLNIWEYSTNPNVETGGGWTKIGTSAYTRDRQLVIPSDSSYNNGLWVTLLNLQDTECVKCNSGYTFSFECNPQITISYYSPEDGDTLITQQITINTPTNEVFNISSSSYGYTSLNIGVLKNIYIKSLMVQYSYDGNGHTPSVFLTPIYNSNGEVEVYTRSEGIPVTTTKAVVADTAVDGTSITVNSSGQLQANIPVVPTVNDATISITQGGVTKGTFTTNQSVNGTIALDAGPDMSSYYTKTQTDSLLDEKIDNDVVQYPLQYLTDTTDNLTYQNVNTSTMVGSGKGIRIRYVDNSNKNVTVGTESGSENLNISSNKATLISNSSLTWFETKLANGFNFAFNNEPVNGEDPLIIVMGHYEDGIFIPDALSGNEIYRGYTPIYIINTDKWYSKYGQNLIVGFYLNGTSLTISTSSNNNSSNFNIEQTEADILNTVTHIRVYKNTTSGSTLALSNIKVINPTFATPVTNGDATTRQTTFNNSTNIFDAHPASLSLKYDSNTLGVNANNELTVPTATTSNKGLVKPDGSTITINNGVISAASSTPSNMVTTNTAQTISGEKKFTNSYIAFDGEYGPRIVQNVNNQVRGVNINYQGIRLCGNGNSVQIDLSSSSNLGQTAYNFTIFQGSNKTYFNQDEYITDKRIFRNKTSSNFLLEKDMLDGTTIQYNGTSGKVEVIGGGSSYTLPTASTSTLGGVKIDGTTITIDNNGVISSTGGSTPSNMVTTDTDQNITGTKQFVNKGIRFFDASGSYSSHVITVGWGEVKVGWNSNNMTWNTNSSSHQFSNGTQNVLYSYGTSTSVAGVVFGGGWRLYRCNSAQNAYYGPNQTTYPYIPYLDSEMLDGTYLKWDSSTKKITVDIQAIKDAIDALSNSSGNASQGPNINPGGWD